jgi:CHASE domain
LTYVEPLDGNAQTVGIDIEAMPERGAALQMLRDSGEAISSGRRLYAERGAKYVGLAMRLPVYRRGMPTGTLEERRRAYIGSVGAGIRIKGMMAGLLSAETMRVMRYRIYDAGSGYAPEVVPSPATLLYDSVAGPDVSSSRGRSPALMGAREADAHSEATSADVPANRHLSRHVIQLFAGRRWLIVLSADPSVLMGSQRYLPEVAVFSGVVISLLLASLTYALSSSRSRAVKVADEMTVGLRESETARAEAQRIAHLGDWRVNLLDGKAHLSNEMARLIGRRTGNPTLNVLARAVEPADRRMLLRHLKTTLATREPFEIECRYRSLRGRRGWLRVIGHACGAVGSGELRGTALEITKQKSIDRARELEHAFTLQLATATNESDAFEELVLMLTKGMDWDAGASGQRKRATSNCCARCIRRLSPRSPRN